MTKAEIYKGIPLPCYPQDLDAAIADLERTWSAEHAGIKHGILLDGGVNKARERILIITFREL